MRNLATSLTLQNKFALNKKHMSYVNISVFIVDFEPPFWRCFQFKHIRNCPLKDVLLKKNLLNITVTNFDQKPLCEIGNKITPWQPQFFWQIHINALQRKNLSFEKIKNYCKIKHKVSKFNLILWQNVKKTQLNR